MKQQENTQIIKQYATIGSQRGFRQAQVTMDSMAIKQLLEFDCQKNFIVLNQNSLQKSILSNFVINSVKPLDIDGMYHFKNGAEIDLDAYNNVKQKLSKSSEYKKEKKMSEAQLKIQKALNEDEEDSDKITEKDLKAKIKQEEILFNQQQNLRKTKIPHTYVVDNPYLQQENKSFNFYRKSGLLANNRQEMEKLVVNYEQQDKQGEQQEINQNLIEQMQQTYKETLSKELCQYQQETEQLIQNLQQQIKSLQKEYQNNDIILNQNKANENQVQHQNIQQNQQQSTSFSSEQTIKTEIYNPQVIANEINDKQNYQTYQFEQNIIEQQIKQQVEQQVQQQINQQLQQQVQIKQNQPTEQDKVILSYIDIKQQFDILQQEKDRLMKLKQYQPDYEQIIQVLVKKLNEQIQLNQNIINQQHIQQIQQQNKHIQQQLSPKSNNIQTIQQPVPSPSRLTDKEKQKIYQKVEQQLEQNQTGKQKQTIQQNEQQMLTVGDIDVAKLQKSLNPQQSQKQIQQDDLVKIAQQTKIDVEKQEKEEQQKKNKVKKVKRHHKSQQKQNDSLNIELSITEKQPVKSKKEDSLIIDL